jgi:hypothetical protein
MERSLLRRAAQHADVFAERRCGRIAPGIPAEDTMLELIAMIAGLVACIMMPIEMGRIRKGWVSRKFTGDRPRFLAAYRKQLRMLMWLGLAFGVAGIGLAAVEARHGEAIAKAIGAAIWFAVSAIAYFSLGKLAKIPDMEPAGSPGV